MAQLEFDDLPMKMVILHVANIANCKSLPEGSCLHLHDDSATELG